MQRTLPALALTVSLATLSMASQAEVLKFKIAPGLWEETHTTLINGKNVEDGMRQQMAAMMARMTPEQRKMMQESMGNRTAGGATLICITPERVAKGFDTDTLKRNLENKAQGCTLDLISSSPSGAKYKAVCSGAQGANYSGNGEYKATSDKEWSFNMVADGKVTGPNGAPVPQAGNFHATQEVHARWKSSDCGKVAAKDSDEQSEQD
jgi:hypothetical protein